MGGFTLDVEKMNHFASYAALAFLALGMVSFASTPLSTQEEIDSTFKNTSLIFRGKIIASTSLWTCGDTEITEAKAREIESAYLKHEEKHIEKFGIANDDAEAIAHREAWRQTSIGSLFMKRIKGVRLVTIRFQSAVKGDFSKLEKSYHVAWETGILQTCSHVGGSTKLGDEVLVFLRGDWRTSAPVLSERFYLLGSPAMKPTKGKQRGAPQAEPASE